MCGIHGIISTRMDAATIAHKLSLMGTVQAHRGPDDERSEVYECCSRRVGFGFVRLAILDLETGMQPVRSAIDQAALICNGQIYNYLELKSGLDDVAWLTKGDSEVALQMLRRFGPELSLQAFNGMYAGAFFDPAKRRVVLFRDRFGIKPLYYRELDGDLWFASEIKPLLQAGGVAEVRKEAFPALFTYRYVPGEETHFCRH